MKPLLSIDFCVGLCVHMCVTVAGHLPVLDIVSVQQSTCNNNLTSTQHEVDLQNFFRKHLRTQQYIKKKKIN